MTSSSLIQAHHFAGYPDPAILGRLREDQVQVCKLDPGAPPQPASLHLPAAVAVNPENTVFGRLWRIVHGRYFMYFLPKVVMNATHMKVPNIASTPATTW